MKKLSFIATIMMVLTSLNSCKKDNGDPTPGGATMPAGNNWVLVGKSVESGSVTRLRSAVYEVEEDGTYTFYFTEESGVTNVGEMLTATKVLKVSGVENPEEELHPEAYVEFTTSDYTLCSDDFAERSVALTYAGGKCTLAIDFEKCKQFTAFYARYNDECREDAIPELTGNAYAVDNSAPTTINSAVESRNEVEGIYTYYLYKEKNVTEADAEKALITLRVPKGLVDGAVAYENGKAPDFKQKFADGLAEGTAIICRDMPENYASNAKGTLYAGYMDSPTGEALRKIIMTYSNDDKMVRVSYSGSVSVVYDSSNTCSANDSESPFGTLFTYHNTTDLKLYFAFGNSSATELSALRRDGESGAWAVSFSIAAGAGDGKFTLNANAITEALSNVTLYDYEDYTTSIASNATLYYYLYDSNVYIKFEAEFNGKKYNAEYYGPANEIKLGSDESMASILTPHEVVTAKLSFYNKNTSLASWVDEKGHESKDMFTPIANAEKVFDIIQLQVTKSNQISVQGGKAGGSGYYYAFYFKRDGLWSGAEVDDPIYYPMLVVPEEAFGKRIKVYDTSDNVYWQYHYNNNTYYQGAALGMYNGQYGQNMPSKGWLQVFQNADHTFNITFCCLELERTEHGEKGSGYTTLLEVRNFPATLYTGTKSDRRGNNNVLTEDDLAVIEK